MQTIEAAAKKELLNYRDEMRNLVIQISTAAKKINPGFAVVPQNALELITNRGEPVSGIAQPYLSSIDAAGCEELFYGHAEDGLKTSADITSYFLKYLKLFRKNNKQVLVIDYVHDIKNADRSCTLNSKYGFISFQADRLLTKIPGRICNSNEEEVTDILKAKNFLCLLNASLFHSRKEYLTALKKTEYDLLVVDAFFWDKILTKKETGLLKLKPSGKKRLVLAYLSVGEAEDYRYYWKKEWNNNKPVFIERENPDWDGNYKVKYWTDEWKEIICGKQDGTGFDGSYLKKIIDAGFNGVYLDVIDAAFYFEKK